MEYMSNFDRGRAFSVLVKKVQSDETLRHVSSKTISEFLDANLYGGITEQELLAAFNDYVMWVK